MQTAKDGDGGESFIEAARREQIMAAAIATIAEEGFARASFVRISKRASISPGLITYHFGTKDELVRKVLDHVGSRLDKAMEGGPEPVASYEEGLRRILTGYVRHCARHPEDMAALREINTATTSPAVLREVTERDESGRGELIAFLVEGQRAGEFRGFDPEVFTDAMFATMQAVPKRLRQRPETECEDYARELADIFVKAATDGAA
ncbi:TetR/AcrR family transcriptional regulator [Streptosporangium carneum]|uniref:Transcriptional regulator, TetR family protein n=1 Tax=Streptosporangium carneum TaxID=47481 RepID=A0A9W6HXC9_9ACTN|nr:TetR/AcrR family transcriptional regulator [Streptosporangium carneum]GLK07491.1 putative transcriptional regulator, TetR family protein [Streptosporangium carneum]